MSDSVWRSKPYRQEYAWLVKNLHPGSARAKAYSEFMISDDQLAELIDAAGDRMRHNEMLLGFLRQHEEAFPCLVAIVSHQEQQDVAKRLRQALFPPTPQQSPPHRACATAAQPDPQLALPADHSIGQRQLSSVYPLDTLATDGAASELESLEGDVRSSTRALVASHSSSDSGMDSDEDKGTVKWMKMRIFREKHSFFSVQECVHTLEETYNVKVKAKCLRESTSVRDQLLDYGDADEKESYDREMATVKIVVGVDKHTTDGERQKLAQNVKKSLKEECGIELVIVNIGDGSIVIYAIIPVEDLIRLYKIATYQPGVLAGLGLLEISTLGRSTRISFRRSPGGPAEEPIHPSLSLLIGDTVPGKAHVITSEPNMHHAVRALVANLPVDGEALPKVIKWLEKHRNDVFNTPSLFAMNPERVQPSSGVSSISTTSPSISGEVRDSTTKKSVVVSLSDSRLTSTEPENLVSELAEQRSAITDGDTRALQLYNLHPLTLAPLMPVISATVIDTACMAAQQAKPDESSRMKPRDVCESIYSQYKDDLETLIVYKEVHNQLVANSVISISRDLEILKGEHRNQGKELFKVLLNKGHVAFWQFIHALEEITQIEVHKEMAMTLRAAAEREHLREQEDCK